MKHTRTNPSDLSVLAARGLLQNESIKSLMVPKDENADDADNAAQNVQND